MAGIDWNEFFNHTYYALDFQFMLGDIEDFLEFSENSIEWQYRSELHRIERQGEVGFLPKELSEYEESYKRDQRANAVHRFTVSLPMRIRYAALISLVTTVEWQVRFFQDRVKKEFEKKPKGRNETAWYLEQLASALNIQSENEIRRFENIVIVRNVIVHSAGLPKDYKYMRRDVEQAVRNLNGFSIGREHFIGEAIHIERGALQPYIEEMGRVIPEIAEIGHKKGLLSGR